MQIVIRNMTLTDLVKNLFYKARLWSYKKLFKWRFNKASVGEHHNMELVFHDDFNSLDKDKWNIGEHWGKFHPNNLRKYWGEPTIDGDIAVFNTKTNPKEFDVEGNKVAIPYESSCLSSYKSFKQQGGYWEMRCKVPVVEGLRSAFWMWGDDEETPYREIDIFEVDSTEGLQKVNVHYGKRENGKSQQLGTWKLDTIRKGEWQIFGFNWTDKKLELFVDGIKVFQLTNKKILEWLKDEQWVVINQSVLGELASEDTEMPVDYIRVYK